MKISCAGIRKEKTAYFLAEKPDKMALFSRDDYKICENYFMAGSGLLSDFQALMRETRKEVNMHITMFDDISENYVNNVIFSRLTKNILDTNSRALETEVIVSGPESMYYVSRETGILKITKGYASGPKKDSALAVIDSFDISKNPEECLKKIEKLWAVNCFIFSTE